MNTKNRNWFHSKCFVPQRTPRTSVSGSVFLAITCASVRKALKLPTHQRQHDTRNAQKQLHCGGLWVHHGVSKTRVVKKIRKLNRLNIITIVKIYMLFNKPMSATSKALLVKPGSFLRLMDTKIISCKEMHSCRCTSSGKNLSTAVGVILVGAWRCRLEIRLHTNMNFLKLKPCAQWKGFPHLEWTSQKKNPRPSKSLPFLY